MAGMGEALGMIFSGAAGEYAGNRANEIRSEDKARLEQAREEKMLAIKNQYDTAARKDTQQFQTSERLDTQDYQAKERQKDRDLTASEGAANRALTASEGAANRASQEARAASRLASSGTGGGGGEEGSEGFDTQWSKNDQGQWGRVDVYANGQRKWIPAPPKVADRLDARDETLASAGGKSEYDKLLDDVEKNADIIAGTGRALMNTTDAGAKIMNVLDIAGSDESKRAMNSYNQLNALRTMGGSSLARANNISGINTVAETKMYAEGMPALDVSSADNLKLSVQKMRDYNDETKRKVRRELGVSEDEYQNIASANQERQQQKQQTEQKPESRMRNDEIPAYTPAHESVQPKTFGAKYGY